MKRLTSIFVFLLLAALPLAAAQTKLVDDVIRMARAGVSDDAIVAFVHQAADRGSVSADDVIAMTEAGVSRIVIQAMLAETSAVAERVDQTNATDDANQPDSGAAAVEDDGGCDTFEPPLLVANPDPPYPGWLWDPYWYLPTLDTRSGAAQATAAADRVAGRSTPPPRVTDRVSAPPPPSRESGGRPAQESGRSEGNGPRSRGNSTRHR